MTPIERGRREAARSASQPEGQGSTGERVEVARGKLTPEYLALSPLEKWETLALHGLLGTDEPWIEDMRVTLRNLATPTRIEDGEVERLTRLLAGRDQFIVDRGLWNDFSDEVATLRPDRDALIEALRMADTALREYACHGGPAAPCLRTSGQCAYECGRPAGDALLIVEAALLIKGNAE